MYSSLLDAPAHTDLAILEILNPDLADWLKRLGLFTGSHIIRHDEEITYHPVRIRLKKRDVIIPAGLGLKIIVHAEDGIRKPLVEMKKKERGHIETLTCGHGCISALSDLGIEEDTDVTFIRSLPHMDYITIIDKKERTRLSEGEAARIWGRDENEESTQFYFARQGTEFSVETIIGGKKIQNHLHTHGVTPGCTLMLETVEQTRELHKPGVEPVTITSAGGLRLYLNPKQAKNIIVKNAVQGGHESSAPEHPVVTDSTGS